LSAKDITKEFDEEFDIPNKVSVGDLVRDTIIIEEDPTEVYIGIVLKIEREGYEKHFQPLNTITGEPIPKLRKPDKCTVYWVHGDRSGETEVVPDWFLKVLSKIE
jgi:hypothetical protein